MGRLAFFGKRQPAYRKVKDNELNEAFLECGNECRNQLMAQLGTIFARWYREHELTDQRSVKDKENQAELYVWSDVIIHVQVYDLLHLEGDYQRQSRRLHMDFIYATGEQTGSEWRTNSAA